MAEQDRSELERVHAALAEAAARGDIDAHNQLMRALDIIEGKGKHPEKSIPPRGPGLRSKPDRKPGPRSQRTESAKALTWGETWRGVPNELARTGLFNIRQAEPRRTLDNEPIATLRHSVMLYSGPELRVRDEDVLLQCYHFQRDRAWGEPWTVHGREFLRAMRWSDGRRGYIDLYDALLRLSKGHLTILRAGAEAEDQSKQVAIAIAGTTREDERIVVKAGTLLDVEFEYAADGAVATITVTMNKRSLTLWQTMGYTLVSWHQRLTLASPLARFLHRFYSSHRDPYPFKVDTLRRLTGSATADLGKFRQLLRTALDALVAVGFLSAWWTDSADLVHVRKAKSDHLA